MIISWLKNRQHRKQDALNCLNELSTHRIPLQIEYPFQESSPIFLINTIQQKKNTIELYSLAPEIKLDNILLNKKITLLSLPNPHHNVRFETIFNRRIREGLDLHHFQLPNSIESIDKRAAHRTKLAITSNYVVMINGHLGIPCKGRLCDISLEGIAAEFAGDLRDSLPICQAPRMCTIQLEQGKEIECQLEIKHRRYDKASNHTIIGRHLVQQTETINTALLQFIANLQVKSYHKHL